MACGQPPRDDPGESNVLSERSESKDIPSVNDTLRRQGVSRGVEGSQTKPPIPRLSTAGRSEPHDIVTKLLTEVPAKA
jgi:hypothetical protein